MQLTKDNINSLKTYKYKSESKVITEKFFWDPICNRLVTLIPKNITPNMITATGACVNLFTNYSLLILCVFHKFFLRTSSFNYSLCIFLAQAAFVFGWVCDMIDGLLAKRTGKMSVVGEVLDHGLDSLVVWPPLLFGLIFGPSPDLFIYTTLAAFAELFLFNLESLLTGVFRQGYIGTSDGIVFGILANLYFGYHVNRSGELGKEMFLHSRAFVENAWLVFIVLNVAHNVFAILKVLYRNRYEKKQKYSKGLFVVLALFFIYISLLNFSFNGMQGNIFVFENFVFLLTVLVSLPAFVNSIIVTKMISSRNRIVFNSSVWKGALLQATLLMVETGILWALEMGRKLKLSGVCVFAIVQLNLSWIYLVDVLNTLSSVKEQMIFIY